MDDNLTLIFTAANVQQANLLKNLLAEHRIAAVVSNEALLGALGGLPLGSATASSVSVATGDADKARQVVEAFERQVDVGASRLGDIRPDAAAAEDAWPKCPSCGNRRQTVCPTCGVAGTDFLPAEYQVTPTPVQNTRTRQCEQGACCGHGSVESPSSDEEPDLSPALLICTTCDEAFEPRYYRLCPWCGFDFDQGIELEQASHSPWNQRTAAVATIIAIGFVAMMVYFWMLFQ